VQLEDVRRDALVTMLQVHGQYWRDSRAGLSRSQSEIAEALGMDVLRVKRAVRELKRYGFLADAGKGSPVPLKSPLKLIRACQSERRSLFVIWWSCRSIEVMVTDYAGQEHWVVFR
jgi:hypothetical protein